MSTRQRFKSSLDRFERVHYLLSYSTPVAMSEDTLLREVTSESMELFNKLQVYLSVICPAMLFDGVAPPGAFENALGTQESTEALMRFVSTSESSVLLIEKSDSNSGTFTAYADCFPLPITYHVFPHIVFHS